MATRSALITGASTGIGAACAVRMVSRGWRVFAGVRRVEDGARLAERCGASLVPLRLEVTDAAQIRLALEGVAQATAETGLQGLVNNAGIAVSGPVELLAIDDLRRRFEVNVFGLVAITQAALPLLRRGRGRIVNMSSIAGRAASPLLAAYAGSKHAVEAISDSLRMELQAQGIEVVVVEPGVINTPIWEKGRTESAAPLLDDARGQRYAELAQALRRFAERQGPKGLPPERVADAVEHALEAARPRTRYLVGRDARIRTLVNWLPDRWSDRLVLSLFRRRAAG